MSEPAPDTDQYLLDFYAQLRALAASLLARESAAQTLQATALVHEAYLRMGGGGDTSPAKSVPTWENRAHFLGSAAESMRRVLVDHARRRKALKRGGDRDRVPLNESKVGESDSNFSPISADFDELLSLDDALDALEAAHPDKAAVVKLRYFVGLSIEDTASVLGISPATCKRYWTFCRAWLKQRLEV